MSAQVEPHELETVVHIERIKHLKARYLRFLDEKRWDDFGELFTGTGRMYYGPGPDDCAVGPRAIAEFVRGALGDVITVHHGHMPEIDVTSETTAVGIWALFGYTDSPHGFTDAAWTGEAAPAERYVKQSYGHHHDEYERGSDGTWRVSSSRVTMLRSDRVSG